MLRLENVIKNYEAGGQSFPALKGISLAFRKSEFVSILGPSGCGKTTLLNIIGGLDHYTSGDLIIEGKSTKQYDSHNWDVYRNYRIGFIFQSYNLIPHQNILENVELALTIAGYSKEEKIKKAMKALDMVGLKNSYKKMPNQLSGGQCQRVAIARALVNEPDILLGDEPTGALDSKTSVQIMKLIKKISKKKLVIMVTHNPPLAKEYSTRIISLLDGDVVNDTNPYKLTEEKKEKREEFKGIKTSSKSNTLVKPSKAKMSFWDAFKLSAKNLISKKKRTIMVVVASSIGIVGVSAVLAVSTGVKGYIATTEKDMLSGNPLSASETSLDLVSILRNVSTTVQMQAVSDSIREKGKIDIEFITGALINQAKEGILISNNIDDKYVQYINYGIQQGEKVSGIVDSFVSYDCDFSNNIYTDADIMEKTEPQPTDPKYIYSLSGLKNIYTGVLDTIPTEDETDFTALANVAANFPSVVYQGLDNVEYLKEQYDLVDYKDKKSSWPTKLSESEQSTGKDFECVVVLNKRKKLGDLIVTLSGLLSQNDFIRVVLEYVKPNPNQEVIEKLSEIAFEKVLGKTFYYIPNGNKNQEGAFKYVDSQTTPFNYNYKFKINDSEHSFDSTQDPNTKIKVGGDSTDETTAKRIKVVGIVTPKDGRNYGSLPSGIYFQSDLANKIMIDAGNTDTTDTTDERNSKIYNYMTNTNNWLSKGGEKPCYSLDYGRFSNKVFLNADGSKLNGWGLYYDLNFCNVKGYTEEGTPIEPFQINTYGTVGNSTKIQKHYDETGKTVEYIEISSTFNTRSLAGRKLGYSASSNDPTFTFKKLPYSVSVYSRDFETKARAKAYLEKWNSKETIHISPTETLEASQRTKITVPDNLTIVINMINNLINITTISLTIFAGLSLVVSTVMIGIITYISVMERIKEIGVIRSLGGRKKDVSHLFNAETFILGSISGLFGILITYVFELVLDVTIFHIYKIPMIADLKWYTAIIMIALSIVLTAVSGLIPARSAAKKDPVTALRTE